MTTIAALIVAAGRGRRFGGEIPKQYAPLAGSPLLHHTLRAFHNHAGVDQVRAVIHPDDRALFDEAAAGLPPTQVVTGGATRQVSVRYGLESLRDDAPDLVLIHDAARPMIDDATISRIIDALAATPGAVAARPVDDSLLRAKNGLIAEPVERTDLWAAQTPQGFRYSDILKAHQAAENADPAHTDDASVARAAGLEIALVDGGARNFKVTTAADLERAAFVLGGRAATPRVGFGFDVHRFGEPAAGIKLQLCGIAVDHDRPLLGHSDADVGLHAATDAILGAIAAGDIGDHFPDTDAQWAGASSDVFLAHAVDLVRRSGGRLVHLDITLICERPKIGPHRQAMIDRVAAICGAPQGAVSVKATTTEKLGFTGRGEGIAAQAVATVAQP